MGDARAGDPVRILIVFPILRRCGSSGGISHPLLGQNSKISTWFSIPGRQAAAEATPAALYVLACHFSQIANPSHQFHPIALILSHRAVYVEIVSPIRRKMYRLGK
ncbi:hypothetical protein D3C85_1345150 [compost metagenome]